MAIEITAELRKIQKESEKRKKKIMQKINKTKRGKQNEWHAHSSQIKTEWNWNENEHSHNTYPTEQNLKIWCKREYSVGLCSLA